MSKQELVSAFLEGRVSRRTLIRRLVAGGISTGAAVSYAQLLRPEQADAASAVSSDDHYPMVNMTITTSSVATAVANGRIGVSVTCTEELKLASFRAFFGKGVPIGQHFIPSFLTAAGTRKIGIPIDTSRLAGRTGALIYVQLVAQDDERYGTVASTRRRLS